MIEIKDNEMWTEFLDQANDLLHEEKAIRHENDHIKSAEICTRIVRFEVIGSSLILVNVDIICI